jgi:Na+/H+-dicarboxylate symporter
MLPGERAWASPWAALAALLAGMMLGTLFPAQLAWLGAAVGALFALLVALAPFLIFLTIAPAVLGLLRAGGAARFALLVVGAVLAGEVLAGLTAIALLAPLFQLGLASPAAQGGSIATIEARPFLVALRSPSLTAVWYGALAALLLHAGARTRLRGLCAPTAEVLTRAGQGAIAVLGRALRLAFPPLLFAVGAFLPTGAREAAATGEATLGGSGLAGLGGASPVAWYFLSVLAHVVILAAVLAGAALLVSRLTGFPLRRLARGYLVEVYAFAWATASSAASLPVNLERARGGLGVRAEVRDFILPLGTTVNRHGSVVSALVLTVVASLLVGYRPGVLDLLVLMLPLVLVVTGAPPVPAGTAVVAPPVVLSVLPIPAAQHAAFAAVFFAFGVGLTDQFRTGVNVTTNGLLALLFERRGPPAGGKVK